MPAILSGDFNINQDNDGFKLIDNSGILNDAYRIAKVPLSEHEHFQQLPPRRSGHGRKNRPHIPHQQFHSREIRRTYRCVSHRVSRCQRQKGCTRPHTERSLPHNDCGEHQEEQEIKAYPYAKENRPARKLFSRRAALFNSKNSDFASICFSDTYDTRKITRLLCKKYKALIFKIQGTYFKICALYFLRFPQVRIYMKLYVGITPHNFLFSYSCARCAASCLHAVEHLLNFLEICVGILAVSKSLG